MSDPNEKEDTMKRPASSGKALCFLKKHLTYKSGDKMYQVLEKDAIGPVKVFVKRLGKQDEVWVRVRKQDGDFLMELVREE